MTNSDKDIKDILNQLSVLEPQANDAPRPTRQALARVQLAVEQQEEGRLLNRIGRFMMQPNRRYATAVALFLIMSIAAFSFPAVRAAASDFLGLFRVQKFAAVSVSPEQIALLQQVAEEGLMPGQIEIIEEPGELLAVDSLAAAKEAARLAAVRTLVGQGEPAGIWVAEGGNNRITVDLARARAIVEAAGGDPLLLPDSLDGAQVTVEAFAGIQQQWADGTVLVQTASPIVDYPDDVDPVVLGEVLLQVLGLDDTEASRLARSIDWTSTVLLPVPQEIASFNEVIIDGVSGMALDSLDGLGSTLFWQKDGIVYILISTDMASDELVLLAGSLR